MLPGSVMHEMSATAPASGRGDGALGVAGRSGGGSEFETMLAGTDARGAKESAAAGQAARNAQSQKTQGETQAGAGRPSAGKADSSLAANDSVEAGNSPPAEAGMSNDPASEAAADGRPARQSGSTEADANTAQRQNDASQLAAESGTDAAVGDDALASASPSADAADAQAAVTGNAAPVPAENAGEGEDAGDTKTGDMKAGDALPAGTPAGDGTQASGSQALAPTPAQASQGAPNPGQQAQGAPKSAPGAAADKAASASPQAPQSQTNSPGDASADQTGGAASAEEGVSNAAAVRRELERGPGRDNAIAAAERASVAKAESGAKDGAPRDAAAAPKASPAQPAPPAGSLAPPANAAPQTFPAMLMALQSGMSAPEMTAPSLDSAGEEIRLESSSALLARSESSAAQGARSGNVLPHLRMASGHVAELGQMIARRFGDGSRSFDIRLDPPELGRVQVRLEIGADRSVQAMLTADKPEALAELQRHARELEKALADAGLYLGENGIGFALSEGDEQTGQGGSQSDGATPALEEHTITLADASTPAPVSRYGFLMTGRTGVDMRI